MKSLIHSNQGNSLIAAMIVAVLTSISMVSFSRFLNNVTRFERGVASNLDLTEIINTFRLITDSKEICSNTGLVGTPIGPLLSPTPSPVAIKLHLPGLKTPGPVFLQAGMSYSQTRKIDSFNMTSLFREGTTNRYLASLKLVTGITGKAVTSRMPAKDFLLKITVDPSTNKISECSASDSTPTPTPSPGIKFYSSTATEPDELQCASSSYYGFYCTAPGDLGWYIDVVFPQAFTSKPVVTAGMVDPNYPPSSATSQSFFTNPSKCANGAIDGFKAMVDEKSITKTGFRLYCGGNPLKDCADASKNFGGMSQKAVCSWTAIGI